MLGACVRGCGVLVVWLWLAFVLGTSFVLLGHLAAACAPYLDQEVCPERGPCRHVCSAGRGGLQARHPTKKNPTKKAVQSSRLLVFPWRGGVYIVEKRARGDPKIKRAASFGRMRLCTPLSHAGNSASAFRAMSLVPFGTVVMGVLCGGRWCLCHAHACPQHTSLASVVAVAAASCPSPQLLVPPLHPTQPTHPTPPHAQAHTLPAPKHHAPGAASRRGQLPRYVVCERGARAPNPPPPIPTPTHPPTPTPKQRNGSKTCPPSPRPTWWPPSSPPSCRTLGSFPSGRWCGTWRASSDFSCGAW